MSTTASKEVWVILDCNKSWIKSYWNIIVEFISMQNKEYKKRKILQWKAEFIRSEYLPRVFPKSAHKDLMYVPLEHVTRKIKFCLQTCTHKSTSVLRTSDYMISNQWAWFLENSNITCKNTWYSNLIQLQLVGQVILHKKLN